MNRFKSYLKYRLRRFLELERHEQEINGRLSALEQTVYQSAGILRPPHEMVFVGPGDFTQVGEVLLKDFVELGQLSPDASVLDVGCGIGRVAAPMTKYLSSNGVYHGFDIVRQGIDWCRANIEPTYPNFHFTWVNLYNRMYNPGGNEAASQFSFPYADGLFDFVCATSVFTHMLTDDMRNYLRQIARVMRSGGQAFITYRVFLIASTAYPGQTTKPRPKMASLSTSSLCAIRMQKIRSESQRFTMARGLAAAMGCVSRTLSLRRRCDRVSVRISRHIGECLCAPA